MNKSSKFKIIEESFLFIDKIGWKEFSIERFAEENKYKTSEVKKFIGNKNDLLIEFSKMIDEKVELNIDIEEFENSDVKDNIFELIMMRFDAMTPFKGGLKKIINEIKSPIILKEISQNILVSMDFYLEFSNAYDDTIFDVIKKNDKRTYLISNINYANALSCFFFRNIYRLKIITIERTPIQELRHHSSPIKLIKNMIKMNF